MKPGEREQYCFTAVSTPRASKSLAASLQAADNQLLKFSSL